MRARKGELRDDLRHRGQRRLRRPWWWAIAAAVIAIILIIIGFASCGTSTPNTPIAATSTPSAPTSTAGAGVTTTAGPVVPPVTAPPTETTTVPPTTAPTTTTTVPSRVNAGSGGAADTGGPIDGSVLVQTLGAAGAGAVRLRRRRAS